ncbi:Photosystem II reaction center W protein, chloroplastic [Triticum urartu]|uniref:PSII 6.1 kDa protein n=2 Tax=Triticum TaxID=4564 RepID=A0A9R0VMM9_TRITD|nr:Photosystem II reaction center W protein, chloroplastic [Triticum urartu]VAH64606.1 unnamed protein product [Triticum turgidum subsp. durum]VAH80453.1 unnamed protein product [Triticum turgidum subsp. durum]
MATISAAAATTVVARAAIARPQALGLPQLRTRSERGTGLSLGLSNNLLGWILLGVFGLIWSLYTVYTSGLDEDEESGGLSL